MPRLIAFIVFDGFQILDTTGPLAAFEIAGRYAPGAYAIKVLAAGPGHVASSSALCLIAGSLSEATDAHTLVMAGGDGSRLASKDETLLDLVRDASKAGRRVTSVCSGAYVLASAGLLDGRRATTHWSRTADFAARFPKVRLEADRIWIRDGDIWTSAGITAGIDLALALIAEDLGEAIAARTARQLVVYHRRAGGQSQFSVLSEIDPGGGRFADLLAWTRENLGRPLDVDQLASRCAMSPRNFARAFRKETGVTPAKAIERLRLEAAKLRIEQTGSDLECIARETGFGGSERMRRAFIRTFGQTAQSLRRLRV